MAYNRQPISYFTSGKVTDQIAEEYGSYLELLDRDDLVRITAICALYRVYRETSGDSHENVFYDAVDTTSYYDSINLLEAQPRFADLLSEFLENQHDSSVNNFIEAIQNLISYYPEAV
ncbi:MAG: hypothetical protein F6K58_19900 [Symploca sp. SIO2E9]|nr:hypothetical protein [Symploca sp. SIO2E9]